MNWKRLFAVLRMAPLLLVLSGLADPHRRLVVGRAVGRGISDPLRAHGE